MFSTNGVYVQSLRGSIWQLGIPSDWPSTIPNTIACRSIGPASASNTFGSNGVYYREQQENIWRVELPNSWVPPQLYNMTKQSGGSSSEAMDLKSNQITAAMPPQRSEQEVWSGEQRNVKEDSHIIFAAGNEPTTTAHESTANVQTEIVWNDEEIWETSSTADEREFVIGLAKRREARDVTDLDSMDAWETSTTIEEAEMITGRSLRRDLCDEWQPSHFRASSGSTASSTSITTISNMDTSPASARARAWANVSAALSCRLYREQELTFPNL